MNIQEIRKQYPQYSDISDGELAGALHRKYYPDISFEEFSQKSGLSGEVKKEAKAISVSGSAAEAGKGLLRGASDIAMGLPKVVGTIVGGPIGGELVSRGAKAIAAPSRALIKAAPEGRVEQFAGTAGELAGLSIVGGGIARPVMGIALPSIAGAVGEQVAGEPGKIAGLLSPLAISGTGALARRAIAGREIERNVAQFKKADTPITLGQATENRFLDGLENVLAKIPGGTKIFGQFTRTQQQGLAPKQAGIAGPEGAGRGREKGITGTSGFLERTKETWNKLDDILTSKVSPQFATAPTNTVAALDKLTGGVRGAEKSTTTLRTGPFTELSENIATDLKASGTGTLPYEALRVIRSQIGTRLDDAMVRDIPQGELKLIYGALSKDMEAAARAAGGAASPGV